MTIGTRPLFVAGLFLVTAACGNAPGIGDNIETQAQRIERQEAEFNASPDIKGDELHKRLNALGIKDRWMTPAREEHDVEIFELRVPKPEFARLDHRALAKLKLDSRYRFVFIDPGQIHVAALYDNAELHRRAQAKAMRELADRGQLDTYPRYHKGMPVSLYAPKLEAWCGYRAGQALRVVDGDWVDYRHAMVDTAAADKDGRALASFDCMKRVVDASTEFRRRFIGNRGREGAIDY